MNADPIAANPSPGRCIQCGLPIASPGSKHGEDFCCYGCYLTHEVLGAKGDEARPTLFLARLGFAAFLAMNAMAFTWALYGDHLPILFPVDDSSKPLLNYLVFVLTLPVFLLIGIPFIRNAVREIASLAPGLDSLIALGTTSAFVFSSYSTFTGSTAVYYDTAAMVLVLVTFGRYLEAGAKVKTNRALEDIAMRTPAAARLVNGGAERFIASEEVSVGDLISILPGEQIPTDGVVIEGKSSVDESVITGEPMPVTRSAGDMVTGGSINHDGWLVIRAVLPGKEMFLARLNALAVAVQASRSPLREITDRVSRWFTLSVILIALLTVLSLAASGRLSEGLMRGLAVLLIACPCALGIGAALAESIGYASATRRGIVVKSLAAFEKIGKVTAAFFDKTGTLTLGKPSVVQVQMNPAAGLSEEEILQLAGAIASKSEHPVSRAIALKAYETGCPMLPVKNFQSLPGDGVGGIVERTKTNSVMVRITKRQPEESTLEYFRKNGQTVVGTTSYIYVDDVCSAAFSLTDRVRPTAFECIDALSRKGIRSVVLSGDDAEVTEELGARLGASRSVGRLLPKDKAGLIEMARRSGEVACMAGDGINDAGALAAADIGIALASGTYISRDAADITIMDGDLRKIPWIITYARKVQRTVRWNLFWAFGYNVAGIVLAAGGVLQPVLAALAMVISSTLVVANSSRLAGTAALSSAIEECPREGERSPVVPGLQPQ